MHKTIIVTGASRGIGHSIALRFASRNYNVVINSLTGGPLLELAEQEISELQLTASKATKDTKATCLAYAGDVGDPRFVKRMINSVKDELGRIDILVNNAGISLIGLVQDMTDEQWQRIISTNLSSVHYCCQNVIPIMLENHSGRIINISSVWGNVGAACEVAYSATKGGVNAYTKALAKELIPSGISVNALACGAINTDMNRFFSKEDLNKLASEIPFGRLGSPDEVAKAVFQLAQMPTYMTGQVITCDGGWT